MKVGNDNQQRESSWICYSLSWSIHGNEIHGGRNVQGWKKDQREVALYVKTQGEDGSSVRVEGVKEGGEP